MNELWGCFKVSPWGLTPMTNHLSRDSMGLDFKVESYIKNAIL